MRLRRRARSTRSATSAAAQLPLRAQALVPFAVALALVVARAAVGAALIARQAVDRELRAQADTARMLTYAQIADTGRRLAAESGEMDVEKVAASSGRALQESLMKFARRERLTLAAVVPAHGPAEGDGRVAWASLPSTRRLLARARSEGRAVYGTARSREGEPFLI